MPDLPWDNAGVLRQHYPSVIDAVCAFYNMIVTLTIVELKAKYDYTAESSQHITPSELKPPISAVLGSASSRDEVRLPSTSAHALVTLAAMMQPYKEPAVPNVQTLS